MHTQGHAAAVYPPIIESPRAFTSSESWREVCYIVLLDGVFSLFAYFATTLSSALTSMHVSMLGGTTWLEVSGYGGGAL